MKVGKDLLDSVTANFQEFVIPVDAFSGVLSLVPFPITFVLENAKLATNGTRRPGMADLAGFLDPIAFLLFDRSQEGDEDLDLKPLERLVNHTTKQLLWR